MAEDVRTVRDSAFRDAGVQLQMSDTPAAGAGAREGAAGEADLGTYTGRSKEDQVTVVSDSEEERQRRVRTKRAVLANVNVNQLRVIEISDSEDEDASGMLAKCACCRSEGSFTTSSGKRCLASPARVEDTPQGIPGKAGTNRPGADDADALTPGCRPRRRLPLDEDVIDLTVESSPEPDSPRRRAQCPSPIRGELRDKDERSSLPDMGVRLRTRRNAKDIAYSAGLIPLFIDDSDDEDGNEPSRTAPDDPFAMDDGSILVLARKPVRRPPQRLFKHNHIDSDGERRINDSPAVPSPSRSLISGARTAVPSPKPANAKTPRTSKKMLMQAQRERLQAYATSFFKELNETVFGGKLPESTELVWSKRLLTTAGRANWRKDRDGRHITHIQLAEKILDCEERIRNTLSHEMCHLACWVISGEPEEQHGPIFKNWARQVMRKRRDVEITTRHNYEINHKYRWKCEDCDKVYGRHSKSINPEEHNSPLVMPGAFPAPPALPADLKTKEKTTTKTRVYVELSEDDESDIEVLAQTFGGVRLKGSEDA
ncbi:hypothetical protein BN946_scf184829.g24 [Trametes cinnabarina]|uniref:SprT-like domain-containing protein n=1 Tax=Pycnoporus cinnabarinus TaxID=5643 RepID=A0A060S9M2_PYCCI|nr:hypothetical protein BN946_scf184829.g24 [Trametes cinnabarina]